MVVRLLGLSVGLSALTAYGLARFNALRRGHRAAADRRSRVRGRVACRAGDAHRRRHRRDVPDVRRRHRHRRADGADDAASAVVSPPNPNPTPTPLIPSLDETGELMQSWMQRHLTAVLGAFVALIALAFVLIVLLFTQLSSTQRRPRRDACRPRARRSRGGAVRVTGPGLPAAARRARADRVGGDRRGDRRAGVVQLVDARVRRGDRREPADRHRDRDRPHVQGADQDVDPDQRELRDDDRGRGTVRVDGAGRRDGAGRHRRAGRPRDRRCRSTRRSRSRRTSP